MTSSVSSSEIDFRGPVYYADFVKELRSGFKDQNPALALDPYESAQKSAFRCTFYVYNLENYNPLTLFLTFCNKPYQANWEFTRAANGSRLQIVNAPSGVAARVTLTWHRSRMERIAVTLKRLVGLLSTIVLLIGLVWLAAALVQRLWSTNSDVIVASKTGLAKRAVLAVARFTLTLIESGTRALLWCVRAVHTKLGALSSYLSVVETPDTTNDYDCSAAGGVGECEFADTEHAESAPTTPTPTPAAAEATPPPPPKQPVKSARPAKATHTPVDPPSVHDVVRQRPKGQAPQKQQKTE
jgi:hypothetical protein